MRSFAHLRSEVTTSPSHRTLVAQMIGAYFAEVERASERLEEEPRRQLLERLGHASELIGTVNPVDALLRWKAPSERR